MLTSTRMHGERNEESKALSTPGRAIFCSLELDPSLDSIPVSTLKVLENVRTMGGGPPPRLELLRAENSPAP